MIPIKCQDFFSLKKEKKRKETQKNKKSFIMSSTIMLGTLKVEFSGPSHFKYM